MNTAFITGRLCKDAEVITTKSGKTITRFCVAVYDGKDGQGNTKSQFINVKVWNCDFSNELHKGTYVKVAGKIEITKNEERGCNYIDIVVNDFDGLAIVPQKSHNQNNGYNSNRGGYNASQNNYDDIAF